MISHLLASVPYGHVPHEVFEIPERPASTGYRRTDRSLQFEVPDVAARLVEGESSWVDPEDED